MANRRRVDDRIYSFRRKVSRQHFCRQLRQIPWQNNFLHIKTTPLASFDERRAYKAVRAGDADDA